MNWQLTTLEQSEIMKDLGITQKTEFSWFGDKDHMTSDNKPWLFTGTTLPRNTMEEDHRRDIEVIDPLAAAFTLSEVAVMLGYGFVPSNIKDATEKLINELKIGTMRISDVNVRLIEAQKQN